MCLALHISRLFSTASSLLRRTPPPQLEDEHTVLREKATAHAQVLPVVSFATVSFAGVPCSAIVVVSPLGVPSCPNASFPRCMDSLADMCLFTGAAQQRDSE